MRMIHDPRFQHPVVYPYEEGQLVPYADMGNKIPAQAIVRAVEGVTREGKRGVEIRHEKSSRRFLFFGPVTVEKVTVKAW